MKDKHFMPVFVESPVQHSDTRPSENSINVEILYCLHFCKLKMVSSARLACHD